MDPPGVHAEHQAIEARHHQPLNVVGIAGAKGLRDGLGHAAHFGLRIPKKTGQWMRCAKGVELGIRGHLCPIDSSHVLAPAKHLPNKALGRLNGHLAPSPGLLHGIHNLSGREEF